jgi:predicted RNA-binding Zn-ribbon protein involved in translation (DUF1610 family)
MVEAASEANSERPGRNRCPRCGAPLVKVHRQARDRVVSVFHSVRRYRCRSADCGWQGLIDRPRTPASLWSSLRRAPAFWFVAGMLATLFAVLMIQVWLVVEHAKPAPISPENWELEPLPIAAGVSQGGKPLEPDDLRLRPPVAPAELRRGCIWGGPGQLPYDGSLRAALVAARLPEPLVDKFAAMRDGALVSDRLEISSAGIRNTTHRRHFGYTMKAMAVERTVCFNTRVNFAAGVVATAELYELVDSDGERHLIMVVPQGGNVAVLDEHTER